MPNIGAVYRHSGTLRQLAKGMSVTGHAYRVLMVRLQKERTIKGLSKDKGQRMDKTQMENGTLYTMTPG